MHVTDFYTQPNKDNPFLYVRNETLPRICDSSGQFISHDNPFERSFAFDVMAHDIATIGVNNICSNVLDKRCKLIPPQLFFTKSVQAHHIGANVMNFMNVHGQHPVTGLELLLPIAQRPLEFFEGFIHGALTSIACIQQKYPANKEFRNWNSVEFFKTFTVGPNVFWYNLLHGLGHAVLMKHAAYIFKDCTPIVHRQHTIPFGVLNAALHECLTISYPHHAPTCAGGVFHTFIEWNQPDDSLRNGMFEFCKTGLFPLQCFQRFVQFARQVEFVNRTRSTVPTHLQSHVDFALSVGWSYTRNPATLLYNEASVRGLMFHLSRPQLVLKSNRRNPPNIQQECNFTRQSTHNTICVERLTHEFYTFGTFKSYRELY